MRVVCSAEWANSEDICDTLSAYWPSRYNFFIFNISFSGWDRTRNFLSTYTPQRMHKVFLFIFFWHNSPTCVVVSCTRSFQASLSLMIWLQFLSFSFFKSLITSSRHLFFGHSLVLTPIGFQSVILTSFKSSILLSPPFYSLFFNVFNNIFRNSLLVFFSLPETELAQILSLMFVFQKLINLCPAQTFRMRRSLPVFVRNSYVPECPAQVGIHFAFGQSCMCVYIQESPFEIQTPADRNPLDRSLTVPPAASRVYCRKGKFGALQRCYLNCLLFL